MVLWQGEKRRPHSPWRQLMLAHCCPRDEQGELILPPIAHPTSRVLRAGLRGDGANRLAMSNAATSVGCEVLWLDAYWFPGGFPNGVGSWRHQQEDSPNGLTPLSDAAQARTAAGSLALPRAPASRAQAAAGTPGMDQVCGRTRGIAWRPRPESAAA